MNEIQLKDSFSYTLLPSSLNQQKNGQKSSTTTTSSSSSSSSRGKVFFVSEDQVLHSAGNILQLTRLTSSKQTHNNNNNNTNSSSHKDRSNNNTLLETHLSALEGKLKHEGRHNIFAYAELGRGFSCYTYNPYLGRVAYSPKSVEPQIIIQSFHKRKEICTIHSGGGGGGGASIEYKDIAFAIDGSRIAAVGKGDIDAKLWVWELSSNESSNNNHNTSNHISENEDIIQEEEEKIIIVPSLIITHSFHHSVDSCAFNPLNKNQISVLPSPCSNIDGKKSDTNDRIVIICDICSKFGKDYIKEKQYPLLEHSEVPLSTKTNSFEPSSSNHTQKQKQYRPLYPTVCAWESQNKLVVGCSDGSILLIDSVSQESFRLSLSPDDALLPPIQCIFVSACYLLIGFQDGTIQWHNRPTDNVNDIRNVQHKIRHSIELVDVLVSPSHENIFTITKTKQGVCISSIENTEASFLSDPQNESTHKDSNVLNQISCLHNGIITTVSHLVLAGRAGISLIVTGGTDGCIKIWKDSRHTIFDTNCKTAIETMHIGSEITSLAVLDRQPVFAVGTADGMVRFIHVAKSKDGTDVLQGVIDVIMTVLKEEQLSTYPVTLLEYNWETKKLGAGCFQSNNAFIFCTATNNLHVLGVIETHDKKPLATIRWCTRDKNHLLIGSIDGIISCIDTMALCFSPDPIDFIWTHKLENISGLHQITLDPSNLSGSHLSFFALHDLQAGVDVFKLIFDEKTKKIVEKSTLQCQVGGMEKHGTCCIFREDCGVLVCGSAAGDLVLYQLHSDGKLVMQFSKCLHSSPVIDLAFSADGRRLFSTAVDGSFMVHNLQGVNSTEILLSSHEYDFLVEKRKLSLNKNNIYGGRDQSTWILRAQDKQKEDSEKKYEQMRNGILQKVDYVKQKVARMLKENDLKDGTEQLNRSDFIIDVESYRKECEAIESYGNNLITGLSTEIDEHFEYIKFLKKEYVEKMEIPFCNLCEISENPKNTITNIPLLKISEADQKRISQIRTLRLNEIVEIQRDKKRASSCGRSWSTSFDKINSESLEFFSPSSTSYLPSCYLKSLNEKNKQDNNSIDHCNEVYDFVEIDEKCPTYKILYPPLAIKSDKQRRIQIKLIQSLTRDVALKFNESFETLRNEKLLTINQLEIKNTRIEEIIDELGLDEEVKKPIQMKSENPNLLEEMINKAVSNEKSWSDSVCDAVAKKDDIDNANSLPNQDDTNNRALMEMMNGTLVVKLSTLKQALERPKWMNTSDSKDLTDAQKEEINRFLQKEKDRHSNLIEQTQKLELEHKDLRTEVADLTSDFNTKLKLLKDDWSAVKKFILHSELYQSILAHKVFKTEHINNRISSLNDNIKKNEIIHDELRNVLNEFQEKSNGLKEELQKTLEEDKLMNKMFRRNIQDATPKPLDQETVRLLYQFYKNRDKSFNELNDKDKRKRNKKNGSTPLTYRSITRRSSIGRQSGRESNEIKDGSFGTYKRSYNKGSKHIDNEYSIVGSMKNAMEEVNGTEVEDVFISPQDPFGLLDIMTKNNPPVDENTSIQPLNKDVIPEGFDIDDIVWKAMQDFRVKKIESEEKVLHSTKAVEEIKRIIDEIKQEEISVKEESTKLKNEIQIAQKEKEKSILCQDLLISTKQGRSEIKPRANCDTILIPHDLLETTNQKIIALEGEKAKMLQKINVSTETLKEMQWNDEVLEIKLNNNKELYVDYQLLRLNADVKMLISGSDYEKESSKNKTMLDLRIEKQKVAHQEKIQKLKKVRNQTIRLIDERTNENIRLEDRLSELRILLRQKQIDTDSNMDEDIKLKVAKQVSQKQLQNQVKLQAQEIKKLRKELDRLILKTFPSFPPQN